MTDKYNDGLDNETVRQIITTYRRPTPQKTKDIISDLGTEIKTNFERSVMYSDKSNLNLNLNLNTLQHNADNEAGEARVNSLEAFGLGVAEERKKIVGITQVRDLDPSLDIVQIEVQMGKIKQGKNKRADVYISIMTIDDKLYTIKLSSDITNAFSEVRRSCRKSQYWTKCVNELTNSNLQDLMIGRARYKTTAHRPLWQTKPNLGNVLVAFCRENDIPTILLYLFTDDPILISLDKELTEPQKKYYQYSGVWQKELDDL
jgi:hypothetical protein